MNPEFFTERVVMGVAGIIALFFGTVISFVIYEFFKASDWKEKLKTIIIYVLAMVAIMLSLFLLGSLLFWIFGVE